MQILPPLLWSGIRHATGADMRVAGTRILTLITADEREVVRKATGRLLPTLSLKELLSLLPRARRLAEKYRDLSHAGRRRRQRAAGGRGAAASDVRAEEKAKLFSEVRRRLEMRRALLEARRERQGAARPRRPKATTVAATVRPAATRSEATRTRKQWIEQQHGTPKPPPRERTRRHAEDLRRIVAGANLERRRAHVGARGRRVQARRDSRGSGR